jgi:hypothetical protein
MRRAAACVAARVAALAGPATKDKPGDYAALPIASYLQAHPEPAAGKGDGKPDQP